MTNLGKISLIILSIILLNISCTKQKWFSKIVYQGTVLDTIGGKPLSGDGFTYEHAPSDLLMLRIAVMNSPLDKRSQTRMDIFIFVIRQLDQIIT